MQNIFERCLFYNTNSKAIQEVPRCQIGGKPIRIYFPVLRPRPSIPAIYQINKSFGYHCYSEQRNTYLSERHADNDKVGTES